MAKVISNHNFKVKNQTKDKIVPGCNCKKGVNNCPLNGACQTQGVVYGAKVTNDTDQTAEFYTGLTARTFKQRLYEHTTSFNKEKKRHKTTLSDHVWNLKLRGEPYTISWWVIDKGKPFNPSTKKCDLCLKEKFHIMFNPQSATLNQRSEIFSVCRHRLSQLLSNYEE